MAARRRGARAPRPKTLAARSRSAARARCPGQRPVAFRLGYDIGFASEFIGSFAMSDARRAGQGGAIGDAPPRARAPAGAIARHRAASPRCRCESPRSSLALHRALRRRRERHRRARSSAPVADPSPSLPARRAVGGEAATVESSGGELTQPPATLIRRHATLAGVAPALWLPLAADARGETPAQVLARYRAALNALSADLRGARLRGQAPASAR